MAYATESHRNLRPAEPDDPELGPLSKLPGLWKNVDPFGGRGWNLIALPFFESGQFRDYRLLMNQYEEELRFTFVDDKVPNRGVDRHPGATANTDQRLVALDYQQAIKQLAADDNPRSGLAGPEDLPIHHEPGLFLHMVDERTDDLDVARLATIPHGNAATALGRSRTIDGAPAIPDLDAFPIGVVDDVANALDALDPADADDQRAYLFPYKHFVDQPFPGREAQPPFPGFSPANVNALLRLGLPPNVVKTTELTFDTSLEQAGIVNIPFVNRQADASLMTASFWIMELEDTDELGNPVLVLAYSQLVMLDFFPRVDGEPGLIRWPHISINMMRKVDVPTSDDPYMLQQNDMYALG